MSDTFIPDEQSRLKNRDKSPLPTGTICTFCSSASADGGHSYSHPSGHTRSAVTAEALAAGPYQAQAPAPACSRERAGSAAMLLVPTAVNRAATVGRRSYGREPSR